ncbi:MAG TPA: hypothetical protein VII20_19520 [Roseiarcus sp.]|jgi:hypothetical protein
MNVQEHYRGFAFTWQDPPETGEGYQISISSEDLDLNGKLEAAEQVRPAKHVLKDAQREAQLFIDSLLSRSRRGKL